MSQKITVRDVFNFLARWAPPSLAEEWDNVGLQVGSFHDSVTDILVSLDVTEAVLWEAVEHRANLLITHHPLIFRPIAQLTDDRLVPRLARLACQTGVNILSFHTNLDATRDGLNDQLAKALGLRSVKPLMPSRAQPRAGLGRIGTVGKMRLDQLLPLIARRMKIKNFRYVGDPKHKIQTVAVMTGSGGNYYREAVQAGADVLVTGDLKYHPALEALAEGIAVVDIGHFAGEIGMVPLVAGRLKKFLRRRAPTLKVFETRLAAEPFQFYSGK